MPREEYQVSLVTSKESIGKLCQFNHKMWLQKRRRYKGGYIMKIKIGSEYRFLKDEPFMIVFETPEELNTVKELLNQSDPKMKKLAFFPEDDYWTEQNMKDWMKS